VNTVAESQNGKDVQIQMRHKGKMRSTKETQRKLFFQNKKGAAVAD
jgi:hypothetical protein